jgi:uncharacterized protein YdaU (DUF1376 family)
MSKDKADIWMPMYWGDYLKDTMHLTTEQHGSYLLIIGAYWSNGGPLDADCIQNITRLNDHAWSIHQAVLKKFFKVNESGQWVHKRLDSELESSKEKKAKAIEKARKAANIRHGNTCLEHATSNASSNQQAVLGPCPSSSSSSSSSSSYAPTPTVRVHTASDDAEFYKSKKGRKLKGKMLEGFNRFWKAFNYPKGKAEAADAYYDLNPDAETTELIIEKAEIEARRRPALQASGKTPKMAQGWLSGRRFEDDYEFPESETRFSKTTLHNLAVAEQLRGK